MATVKRDLSLLDYLLRVLGPLLLVLASYNPSGTSAFHWVGGAISAGEFGALHFLALVVLAIGWSILLVATWNSLDTFGVILTGCLLGGLVWLLIEWGILAANSTSAITWIVLVCLAGVLSVGLSWSHAWRRLTGQYAVDDADD
jgi:hypothetical protein